MIYDEVGYFHEIIYGHLKELQYFSTFLNENLLLDSYNTVTELDRTRRILQDQGYDVETDDEFEKFGGIAVFSYIDYKRSRYPMPNVD